jgi:hypothetical protein
MARLAAVQADAEAEARQARIAELRSRADTVLARIDRAVGGKRVSFHEAVANHERRKRGIARHRPNWALDEATGEPYDINIRGGESGLNVLDENGNWVPLEYRDAKITSVRW